MRNVPQRPTSGPIPGGAGFPGERHGRGLGRQRIQRADFPGARQRVQPADFQVERLTERLRVLPRPDFLATSEALRSWPDRLCVDRRARRGRLPGVSQGAKPR